MDVPAVHPSSGTAVVFVDNPDPDFFLDVRPRLVQGGQSAEVSLAPSFVTALDDEGVTVSAELVRPGGSRAPLAVTHTAGRGYAYLDPARVDCDLDTFPGTRKCLDYPKDIRDWAVSFKLGR